MRHPNDVAGESGPEKAVEVLRNSITRKRKKDTHNRNH